MDGWASVFAVLTAYVKKGLSPVIVHKIFQIKVYDSGGVNINHTFCKYARNIRLKSVPW